MGSGSRILGSDYRLFSIKDYGGRNGFYLGSGLSISDATKYDGFATEVWSVIHKGSGGDLQSVKINSLHYANGTITVEWEDPLPDLAKTLDGLRQAYGGRDELMHDAIALLEHYSKQT